MDGPPATSYPRAAGSDQNYKAELSQELGEEPSPAQLATQLNAALEDVVEALAADGCYTAASLDQTTRGDDDLSVYEVFGEEDSGFHRTETVVALRPLCQQLPKRDAKILRLRFFEEWTQQRIADELGITQMQVSRLLTRILAQLRRDLAATPPTQHPPKSA